MAVDGPYRCSDVRRESRAAEPAHRRRSRAVRARRRESLIGALQIVKPGLLTTVQDLGRYGHQASGVPVAGPMDTFSHRLANQLVANDLTAATLEITLIGPELIVDAQTTMAIAGAHFEVTCDDRQLPIG